MAGIVNTALNREDPLGSVKGYEASQIELGGDDSVQGQIDKIIRQGSPLAKMAETRSDQQMNSRGLKNSSIAVGAGQAALYDYALPIAQQDAATSYDSKKSNTAFKNQADQFTASEANTGASILESGNQQIRSIDQQGIVNSRLQREGHEQGLEMLGAETSSASQLQSERHGQGLETIGAQTEAESRLQSESAQQQMARLVESGNIEQALQQLKGEQAETLSLIETRNAQLMQASQSAATFFSNTSLAIGEILSNPDIPANQKQALVDKQLSLLNGGLNVMGTISNIDLSNLLTFTPTGDIPAGTGGTGGNTGTGGNNNTGNTGGLGGEDNEGAGVVDGGGNNAGQNSEYQPGVQGVTASGDGYFVPSGYNWNNFINQPGNEDLKAAYDQQQWASSPEQWANELWASQAIQNGDPRFIAEFGVGGSNSGTGGNTGAAQDDNTSQAGTNTGTGSANDNQSGSVVDGSTGNADDFTGNPAPDHENPSANVDGAQNLHPDHIYNMVYNYRQGNVAPDVATREIVSALNSRNISAQEFAQTHGFALSEVLALANQAGVSINKTYMSQYSAPQQEPEPQQQAPEPEPQQQEPEPQYVPEPEPEPNYEQQAQEIIDQQQAGDDAATDAEISGAVSAFKSAGWSLEQIAQYAAELYGGSASDYMGQLGAYY